MRNLKKFLALVLAMVMAMSLMVTANASGKWQNAFKDEDITEEFHEAVDVLAGLGVYKGQDGGVFAPKAEITRAETAALIYRIATGDVNDTQDYLYKQYGRFSDVNENAWYAGYVGYASNAEIIKGYNGQFFPNVRVTGFEVLAMILRTIGYDENGEFTGSGWQVRVASRAQDLGILVNLNETPYANTLNQYANREVVAELLFQTMVKVPRVQWTAALGQYNEKDQLTGGNFNPTQGQYIFGLYQTEASGRDKWGAPSASINWRKNGTFTGDYTTAVNGGIYKDPVGHPIYDGVYNAATLVATCDVSPKPLKEYFTTVLECDVAHDLGIEIQRNFVLFVNGTNGSANIAGATDADYKIQATDTTTKVGGQGRWTRFFSDGTCVMVDTMLARVTAKTPSRVDRNDHVIIPAQLEVTIYDGPNTTDTLAGNTSANGSTSNRTISKPLTTAENWDEYSVGDFILLNAYTNKSARTTSAQRESAAFETNKVVTGTDMRNSAQDVELLYINDGIYIVDNGNNGLAKHFTGKQTVVSVNTGKHIVDGTPYDDQLCLFLDRAGTTVNNRFEWYFDEHDNIIGIGDATKSNFGVITGIYASLDQGTSSTTGAVKAVATVKFADGTTGPVVIDRFAMSYDSAKGSSGWPTAPDNNLPGQTNDMTPAGVPLAPGAGGNTIELRPVYDTVANEPLSASEPNPTFTPVDAPVAGWLYLAVSTASNTNAHFAVDAGVPDTCDGFGILYNHMFEFVTASDDSMVAVEVAGSQTNYISNNTGIYAGKVNAVLANEGKLFKNTAWMTLDNSAPATAASSVYLNENTQILIRVGNNISSTIINPYTVNTLPGDVTLPVGAEVDWADVDGDGRADYVYINYGEIPSVIDYALFYFNGGAASWDGATGTGTAQGYLNGKPATVTFDDLEQYKTVAYSTQTYLGHLFALQLTDGVVSDVMVREDAGSNDWTSNLLDTYDTGNTRWESLTAVTTENPLKDFNTNIKTSETAHATGFVYGVPTTPNATNPYSLSTAAVYYYDFNTGLAGATDLRYERASNGYKVVEYNYLGVKTGVEYWISPNATIEGTLEWLNTRVNYVTIVYESNAANAIMEIYITPVPDVTPSGGQDRPTPTTPVAGSISGSDVLKPTSAGALGAALLAATPNTVLYCPAALPGTYSGINFDTTLDIGGADKTKLIYFSWHGAPGMSGEQQSFTLTIRDEDGNLVYSESLTDTTGANNVWIIVVDIASNSNSGYNADMPLYAGQTYSFAVTNSAGATVSSGTFTAGV